MSEFISIVVGVILGFSICALLSASKIEAIRNRHK